MKSKPHSWLKVALPFILLMFGYLIIDNMFSFSRTTNVVAFSLSATAIGIIYLITTFDMNKK